MKVMHKGSSVIQGLGPNKPGKSRKKTSGPRKSWKSA